MNTMRHIVAVLYGLTVFILNSNGKREILAIIMGPDQPWFLTDNSAQPRVLTNNVAQLDPPPPPPDQDAQMARFIVHYSLWGSLSHISLQPSTKGLPIARVYSVSDGPLQNSSGVPYFYMTGNDPEFRDMLTDPRASLTLTLAQTPYCKAKAYDPEDPRCAQIILTGKLVILKNSTAEWLRAEEAMFSRHPSMKNWPEGHHWIFCKLDIKKILLVDNFGGNKHPSLEDYFKASPNTCSHENSILEMAFY